MRGTVRTHLTRALLVCGALSGAPGAFAQDFPSVTDLSLPRSVQGILTLDWEALYEGSAWGKRVNAELTQASIELNAENDRIAENLVTEERALTDQRASMEPDVFKEAAQAFDQRATSIRAEQKAKAQALQARLEQERQAFVQAALPVLDEMLMARGAAVVLDRRVILRGLSNIDVTSDLIILVDKRIGTGKAD